MLKKVKRQLSPSRCEKDQKTYWDYICLHNDINITFPIYRPSMESYGEFVLDFIFQPDNLLLPYYTFEYESKKLFFRKEKL